MEFHHIGIPTALERPKENHMADAKLFVTNPDDSVARIEWLRFEEGSPLPDLLKTEAHIAYLVDDVDAAMAGKELLMEPFEPGPGTRVGFVIEDGMPIEFMSVAKG
ncbi:VOC family protein [Aliiruegeria sabulilitoris]|uniref:VOC family protein n=1 Tax=Aliiruegeria sabulilitoris TaxID=1510458 RepID=UPI000829819A|nr:glyoxalase/bleomycin resistance/dioxygenase family protein [Aliiruegeria sabulilitoris]